MSSARALALVEQLWETAEPLIALVDRIGPAQWIRVARPGVWSPGKDAEHVAEGAAYHLWIVRRSLGQRAGARPALERELVNATLSQREVVDLLRRRTEASAALAQGLSEAQLELPVRPPRARARILAEMIEAQLIGHYQVHREAIEAKLRAS